MRQLIRIVACGAAVAVVAAAPSHAATGGQQSVKVWFTSGEQFRTVQRTLPASGTTLLQTIRALLKGPTAAELRRNIDTQIPKGVTLTRFSVTGDGTAVVELSPGFLKGVPAVAAQRSDAQTATLRARLGQVIYTVTQFGDIRSAQVQAGSLVLDSKLERADYTRPSTKPKPPARPPGQAIPGTREIQQRLAATGYLPKDAVDGRAGYRTQQAVMAFQAWNGLQRDGVAGPATAAKLAKATTPKPFASGPARRIEVDRTRGVALLISSGKVVRAIHVSTGAGANATPSGRYSVFRKELRSWSVPFKTWLPYASYFNNGIAFHEYPDVPAFPASHGCVRVPAPEAPVVYAFASSGTAVVVR
jgi:lipoprotein-anchoring transpeptidase ErfK/SrfK